MSDHYLPLPDGASLEGCWLMVIGEVNLDDLTHPGTGKIIRMDKPDSLRYVPSPIESYERLAGLISDAA